MGATLAFWQFGSAGMLAWGLAAALPILIHLWSRRKYRQERWAAMAFLLAALRKNARRVQLEQWVLLAVRTAILLLFALALADPQSSLLSGLANEADVPVHVILVIDGSYSMDFRTGESTYFQAAKKFARQLVADGGPGDGYSLVLMSRPPRVVISDAATERDVVLREIDDLDVQHTDADLPATLAEIETIVMRSKARAESAERLAACEVYFFSDVQKTTWTEVTSPVCRDQLARLAALAQLQLVDVGRGDESNLAVARVEIDQPLVGAGREVQVQAEIESHARENRPRQTIEFLVDGEQVSQKQIDCPAGGRATVSASLRFDAAGEHVVEARLADDALPLDNRRWLSVPVRATVRVLCIGGRPAEARYVSLALAADQSPGKWLEVIEAAESRLLEDDLLEFDALILANIGRLSRAEAAALHRFVNSGRGLIVFLGDQVQPENYNQLLVDDENQRCLPARLIEPASIASYTFDPLDYRHSLTAPFRGFPNAGLITTPTWQYFRLAPLEGAETALCFSSHDPAIVEMRIGRGVCFVVATAASPDSLIRGLDPPTPWTALPIWPSFPPLMHEMLRLALVGRTAERNIVVGEDLTGSLSDNVVDSTLVLKGPGRQQERLRACEIEGERRWTLSNASRSGVYEARHGDTTELYAVNLDAKEGDLARLDRELLPSPLRRASDEEASQRAVGAQKPSHAHFRWLLAAVLTLLIAEPLLAWQFGRGRS